MADPQLNVNDFCCFEIFFAVVFNDFAVGFLFCVYINLFLPVRIGRGNEEKLYIKFSV